MVLTLGCEMAKFKLVKVDWIDAAGNTSWQHLRDAQRANPSKIVTIGYKIRDDKTALTIAGSITENLNVHDTTVIPRGWVTKITPLRGHDYEYQEPK